MGYSSIIKYNKRRLKNGGILNVQERQCDDRSR